MENDWSGRFVLLYGWNNEDIRWDFSLFKSIGKLWAILVFPARRATQKLFITSQWISIEKIPLYIFIISSME